MIDSNFLEVAIGRAGSAGVAKGDGVVLSPCLGRSGCRVGVDVVGNIVLAVPPSDAFGVQLERLEYRPSLMLTMIDDSGASWEELAGSIVCNVETEAERRVILGVFAHLVNDLDDIGDVAAVGRDVSALQALFTALQSSSAREEVGLWGELFIIAHAVDPIALAAGWGADPDRVFDFAMPGHRLEVKTTAGGHRRHIFSLPQLLQGRQVNTAVVSIVTTESGAGTSVLQLLEKADQRLRSRADLRHAILDRTVKVAGSSLNKPRLFDEGHATSTLRVVPFSGVPQPLEADGIVDLSWTVGLPMSLASDYSFANPLVDAFKG